MDCPIIGISQILQDGEVEPSSIRALAKNYADRIQAVDPAGSYNILGWSFGGVVAHELAVELQRRGCVIGRLILLDAQPSIDSSVALPSDDAWRAFAQERVLEEALRFYRMSVPERDESHAAYKQVEELIGDQVAVEFSPHKQFVELLVENLGNNMAWQRAHEAAVFAGDIVIFSAVRDEGDRSSSLLQSWRPHVTGEIALHAVNCTHEELLTTESVSMYGKQLQHIISTCREF